MLLSHYAIIIVSLCVCFHTQNIHKWIASVIQYVFVSIWFNVCITDITAKGVTICSLPLPINLASKEDGLQLIAAASALAQVTRMPAHMNVGWREWYLFCSWLWSCLDTFACRCCIPSGAECVRWWRWWRVCSLLRWLFINCDSFASYLPIVSSVARVLFVRRLLEWCCYVGAAATTPRYSTAAGSSGFM